MIHLFERAALQITDTGSRRDACADCPAECRQPADSRLLVNRNQIGQCECTVHFFLRNPELARIHDNRYRARNPLIAGAGVDDNRHLAAVHAGVRACSRHRNGLVVNLIIFHLQNDRADIRAPRIAKSLLGNRHIAGNLPVEHLLHIRDITRLSKIPDLLDCQEASVRQGRLLVRSELHLLYYRPVLFLKNDIRVIIHNTDLRRVITACLCDDNIKDVAVVHKLYSDLMLFQILRNLTSLLIRNLADYLEQPVRDSGHHACCGGGPDPLQMARIRHDNRFDILDN